MAPKLDGLLGGWAADDSVLELLARRVERLLLVELLPNSFSPSLLLLRLKGVGEYFLRMFCGDALRRRRDRDD